MQINIQRDRKTETFSIVPTKATTLLAALYEIKSKLDPTLTFGAGCRSGVCGSCAVLVNGKEQLACSYTYQESDLIEPLRYHPVIRDLKVDKTKAHETLSKIGIPSAEIQNVNSMFDPRKIEIQTSCILCDSCYSACPVLAVNPDFLGPFTLTRAWRYIADGGQLQGGFSADTSSILLENIQKQGIWDCTLCGECTTACPQGIDPKTDIMLLRGESGKAGYSDPNFAVQDFGAPDFGNQFNPNAGF
jgi:fumarate reductase iron-sulfur subunit